MIVHWGPQSETYVPVDAALSPVLGMIPPFCPAPLRAPGEILSVPVYGGPVP